ncbi:hypothetical protein HanPI659440_Chr02g0041571 [Helianthus annuus]|nr:hypothetical protein HanPI659440_Chr02g0041571 [Helianthus annuus]
MKKNGVAELENLFRILVSKTCFRCCSNDDYGDALMFQKACFGKLLCISKSLFQESLI